MKKLLIALVGASAFTLSAITGPAAADQGGVQACPGDLVSTAVQVFGGRRAVAETFFGDYPQAVQDAQSFMEAFCDVGP
jgi:hypothetical protein